MCPLLFNGMMDEILDYVIPAVSHEQVSPIFLINVMAEFTDCFFWENSVQNFLHLPIFTINQFNLSFVFDLDEHFYDLYGKHSLFSHQNTLYVHIIIA